MDMSYPDATSHGDHENRHVEGESYIPSTDTVSRTAHAPNLNTIISSRNEPLNPSPRLRVAFNRETSLLLEPQRFPPQTSAAEEPSSQLQKTCPQKDTPHIDTEAILPLTHTTEQTPSPKGTNYDLEYHKPGLHRGESGFDDEFAQARSFARQVSRREESPPQRRRRTPQMAEQSMREQQQARRPSGLASPLGLNGREDCGEDAERGRRRRRIGSEKDCEMADV